MHKVCYQRKRLKTLSIYQVSDASFLLVAVYYDIKLQVAASFLFKVLWILGVKCPFVLLKVTIKNVPLSKSFLLLHFGSTETAHLWSIFFMNSEWSMPQKVKYRFCYLESKIYLKFKELLIQLVFNMALCAPWHSH